MSPLGVSAYMNITTRVNITVCVAVYSNRVGFNVSRNIAFDFYVLAGADVSVNVSADYYCVVSVEVLVNVAVDYLALA